MTNTILVFLLGGFFNALFIVVWGLGQVKPDRIASGLVWSAALGFATLATLVGVWSVIR